MFKPLQRGIMSCMSCQNVKVMKAVHTLLQKLLSLFPIETMVPGATSGSGGGAQLKVEQNELDTLYANIGTSIYDGLLR